MSKLTTTSKRKRGFHLAVMLWLANFPYQIKALPSENDGVIRGAFARAPRTSQVKNTPKDLEDLYNKLIYWSHEGNNGSQCQLSLIRFESDLMDGRTYAKKALDATGKLGSGVFTGNYQWFGRYYECLDIDEDEFQGRWCTVKHMIPNSMTNILQGMTVGICLPNTCKVEDVTDFLSHISNGSLSNGWTASCPAQPMQWKATDFLFVIVFSLFVIALIVGTLLEVRINNRNKTGGEILVDDSEIVTEPSSNTATTLRGWERALLSFSIIKNTKSLLKVDRKQTTINCIHGLRFVSMTWIVLGHTFYYLRNKVDNIFDMYNFMTSNISFLAITNSVLAVDTFFFISGLLVAYLAVRDIDRLTGKRVPKLYLMRYLRLTPSYAFMILFMVGSYGKLGNGPFWEDTYTYRKSKCEKYWWTNLLYINNLHPEGFMEQCFSMGWYLSNDMQFFLLAPISLLILKRNRFLGLGLIIFGIFSSMLVTGVISAHYDSQPVPLLPAIAFKALNMTTFRRINAYGSIDNTDKFWNETYERPWCRISAYLIGMLTGYMLPTAKSSIRMSRIYVICGWGIATVLNVTALYGIWWWVHNLESMEASLAALYNAMSKPVWACGLAWVVIACATGNGGPVDAFLSWKVLVPLSRLTYSIYLVQGPIVHWWFGSIEVNYHYSLVQMPIFFLGFLTLASGFGYALSMLVEMPMVNLMRLLMERQSANSNN